MAYHPQTSVQIKVSNKHIKQILEKTISRNRKTCANKLIDALWAYSTAFGTPLGMSPFRVVFDKPCRLYVELEHRTMWAMKTLNLKLRGHQGREEVAIE